MHRDQAVRCRRQTRGEPGHFGKLQETGSEDTDYIALMTHMTSHDMLFALQPSSSKYASCSPRRSFFFQECDFRVYWFHGHLRKADTSIEKLYRCMGVRDAPNAHTLARVTERVDKEFRESCRSCLFEHQKEILERCLFSFCYLAADSDHESFSNMNFFFLDECNQVSNVSDLVSHLNWIEMDWRSGILSISALKQITQVL